MSAILEQQDYAELATLLIPVGGRQLLLPNVTVAEIIPYTEADSVSGRPDWFLGEISWRDTRVPLVSFERLNGEPVPAAARKRRIALLNGLVDQEKLPFCAIVTEGVPRLMRVMADEVLVDEEARVGTAELSRVVVNGEKAVIPNVDYIQQQILDSLAE